MAAHPKHFYEFGPFRIDVSERELLRDGKVALITPKVFDLLLVLVRNNGVTVDKETLMKEVWPDSFVEEANLSVNMTMLRRGLGESPEGHRYIETVPRRGYRFVATVIEGWDGVGGPSIRSMAVLPFLPLTKESQDEYLEFGMADTLITRLSRIRKLIVRPSSAVRKYASRDRDPLAAGRELKVDAVLDASIQRLPGRILVNWRLTSVAEGKPLGADSCDLSCTDIFEVQDSIAQEIAAAVKLETTGEEKALLARRGTYNHEAWELYEKGRFFWNRMEEDSLGKSLRYFQKAINLDPKYALAYAGLANSHVFLGTFYHDMREEAPRATELAEKALMIDDKLGEARAILARLRSIYYFEWRAADHEFKEAFRLSPNYAMGHNWYAHFLAAIGRLDDGVQEVMLAHRLDPTSAVISANVAWLLYVSRRYEEAEEQCQKTIDVEPDFWIAHSTLADVYRALGRNNEAFECEMKRVGNPQEIADLRRVYAESGWRGIYRKEIAELTNLTAKGQKLSPISLRELAFCYSQVGDHNHAIEYLQEAYNRREWPIMMLDVDPLHDNVRSDLRFQELVRKMNLVP